MWAKNYRPELSKKYFKPVIKSKDSFETKDKTIGFEEQNRKLVKNFFMNQNNDESSTNIDEFHEVIGLIKLIFAIINFISVKINPLYILVKTSPYTTNSTL